MDDRQQTGTELTPEERWKETGREVLMKRVLEVDGWLIAILLFAFASHAIFA